MAVGLPPPEVGVLAGFPLPFPLLPLLPGWKPGMLVFKHVSSGIVPQLWRASASTASADESRDLLVIRQSLLMEIVVLCQRLVTASSWNNLQNSQKGYVDCIFAHP